LHIVLSEWLAPVLGNPLKARCRPCRVVLNAHFTGLLQHARTSKHIQNMQPRSGKATPHVANGLCLVDRFLAIVVYYANCSRDNIVETL